MGWLLICTFIFRSKRSLVILRSYSSTLLSLHDLSYQPGSWQSCVEDGGTVLWWLDYGPELRLHIWTFYPVWYFRGSSEQWLCLHSLIYCQGGEVSWPKVGLASVTVTAYPKTKTCFYSVLARECSPRSGRHTRHRSWTSSWRRASRKPLTYSPARLSRAWKIRY